MAPLAQRRVAPALRPSLAVPGPTVAARSRSRELWLAVHLPSLLLDALRDQTSALSQRAHLAVVDLERDGKVVRACDAAAQAAGVRAGMSVNSALTLAPGLQTLARDVGRERQLLEAVACQGLRFTPRVSIEPPDGVLLEVRGSLRLFGGARQLCRRVQQEVVETTGATVRFAITPTSLASSWFARLNVDERAVLVRGREELPGRLAPLPLACTRWPERTLQTLATMGVRTVGECLRLPRDGFARRFGADLLAMLDRATGRIAEPRAAFAVHEKFALRRDLEPEVVDIGRLQVGLQLMVDDLCRFLRERSRGIQALEIQLHYREAPTTRVRLRFVQPVGAQPRRIVELLRERLARLELTAPVRNVRLVSGPLLDLPADASELFAHDRRESGIHVPQLVERLRARFGNAAVHGLACVAEHRPEAAWRAVEPLGSPLPMAKIACDAGEGQRPLWLLDVPEPCEAGGLEFEEGPECIESGWWDGHDVARDYYVARNRHGARLWVFRNRRSADAPGWFLHGWFA
jgi:protein ImuB